MLRAFRKLLLAKTLAATTETTQILPRCGPTQLLLHEKTSWNLLHEYVEAKKKNTSETLIKN